MGLEVATIAYIASAVVAAAGTSYTIVEGENQKAAIKKNEKLAQDQKDEAEALQLEEMERQKRANEALTVTENDIANAQKKRKKEGLLSTIYADQQTNAQKGNLLGLPGTAVNAKTKLGE